MSNQDPDYGLNHGALSPAEFRQGHRAQHEAIDGATAALIGFPSGL